MSGSVWAPRQLLLVKHASQHTNTQTHSVIEDVEFRLPFAGLPVHRPERGIPFMVQVMVGRGMPSAWQSSFTVSPGAYSWLTGSLIQ